MVNRQNVMRRAWAIFRQTYNYPALSWKSVEYSDRRCFGSCLRCAWAELREATRLSSISGDVKAARSKALSHEMMLLTFREDYRAAQVRRCEIETELAHLAA